MEKEALSHSDREFLRQVAMEFMHGVNSTKGGYIHVRKTLAQNISINLMGIANQI